MKKYSKIKWMKKINIFWLFFILIVSCSEKKSNLLKGKIEYNIYHYDSDDNHIGFYFFESIDTLYLYEKSSKNIERFQKVRLSRNDLNKMKNVIINHFKISFLAKKKVRVNSSGFLQLQVKRKDKYIEATFEDVDGNFNISDEFVSMFTELKNNNGEVNSFFNND